MNDPDPYRDHRDQRSPIRESTPSTSIGMKIFKVLLWIVGGSVALVVLAVGLVLGTCFLGR